MIDRSTLVKDWGKDHFVFNNSSTIIRRLEINKGGLSTFGKFHRHRHKYNRFFVESGQIKVIELIRNGETEKERVNIIGDGQPYRKYDVFPGIRHRFEALEDSIVYEIYWVFCDGDDIVREV